MSRRPPQPFTNWAGNHRCRPLSVQTPRNDDELVELIERARRRGETIKPVGAGHSWTDIACTDGHLVSLDADNAVLDIDRRRHTITVRAGIRLRQLTRALAAHGLAMANLGSVAEQSIAGAISTGTHGSGIKFGNLATQVIAMRLVTGTGQVLRLSAEDEPELFSAARVGLGALGVITQVTLQCVPPFHLCERTRAMPFERAMRDMQALVDTHDHTKLWWLPHTGLVLVSRYDRVHDRCSRGASLQHYLEHHPLTTLALEGMTRLGNALPWTIPAVNRTVSLAYTRPVDRVSRSEHLFHTVMPPRHLEMEYAIPRARAEEAAERLRALVFDHRLRVNFIQELRFVAADDIMLSPAFARDSCHFGVYIGAHADHRRYFELAEAMLLDLDGRPHWGKCFSIDHTELSARLPNFERFAEIRRTLDPDGVFVNPFVRRVFGL